MNMTTEPLTPMSFNDREALKQRGEEMLREGRSLKTRTHGARHLIEGWYARSYEYAQRHGHSDFHPSFRDYVRMIAAGSFRTKPDVVEALRRRNGPACDGLEPGDSIWRPAQNCSVV